MSALAIAGVMLTSVARGASPAEIRPAGAVTQGSFQPFRWLQLSGRPVGLPQVPPGGAGRGLDSYRVPPASPAAPPRPAVGVTPHMVPLVSDAYSCVPYARAASGINIIGDAATWWDKAAGVYARGSRPEPGSVLSFRAAPQMPLGHVAVVSRLINARLITVDHSNWGGARNTIMRAVAVLDVSPANDWTQVRLPVAESADYGGLYETSGFIYRRPAPAMLAGR